MRRVERTAKGSRHMLKNAGIFGSFSVNDLKTAREFYGKTLGVKVENVDEMPILNIGGENGVMIYEKPDHAPATFTVLNFRVDNLKSTMKELKAKGVRFEIYDMEGLKTDSEGVVTHGEMSIAWFKDPAGNILSVLQEK
jgi:predicted enzyme related to lactoylglutathione lyase